MSGGRRLEGFTPLGYWVGEHACRLVPATAFGIALTKLLAGGAGFTVVALAGLALFGDAPSNHLLAHLGAKLGRKD